MTQEIKAEMQKVVEQKQEEINSLKEESQKHREAREEISRFVSNTFEHWVDMTTFFPVFIYILYFIFLIEYCWRCSLV